MTDGGVGAAEAEVGLGHNVRDIRSLLLRLSPAPKLLHAIPQTSFPPPHRLTHAPYISPPWHFAISEICAGAGAEESDSPRPSGESRR